MKRSGAIGDWSDLARKGRLQLADWIAEKCLFVVSLSAAVLVILVVLFVVRESLPFFGGAVAGDRPAGETFSIGWAASLAVGSLKVSLTALFFAVPIAIGAALYVSQLAPAGIREWVRPLVETLAGVPSVVLGSLAVVVLSVGLQSLFGYPWRFNALTAGMVLGLAVVPLIFSIAESALTSVPVSFRQAAFALGSSRWQAACWVVLPAAFPGVCAAVALGFGRAVGETMIVLMAAGDAGVLSWSLLDSSRPMTAAIAAELPSVLFAGRHYRVLFVLGGVLFAVTYAVNLVGDWILCRLKRRLEAKSF